MATGLLIDQCTNPGCQRIACTYRLNADGRQIPALCCQHQAAVMVGFADAIERQSDRTTAQEGLQLYREAHAQHHDSRGN